MNGALAALACSTKSFQLSRSSSSKATVGPSSVMPARLGMRRRRLLVGLAAAPLVARADEPLPVVASFSVLGDMVREVGGDAVTVKTLVPPDGDAHTYQPRPSDLLAIKSARVAILNGLGFDTWMDRLLASAGGTAVRVTATGAVPHRQMTEVRKTILDPHAWQDPSNGVLYARAIADGLAKADTVRASLFRGRAGDFVRSIEETDSWSVGRLARVPPAKRKIITSHDAFGYFGARYGVTFEAVQGISTEGEPSARDLARLAAQIKREHIRAVFVENMMDPRVAQALAREAGAVVGGTVYSDALSAPGGPADTYLQMFRHNVPLFAAAMAQNEV